jgi:hypothetical protein
MLKQKVLKANGAEGFSIVIYGIGFIFLSYLLFNASEHLYILKISSILIWFIACIFQIYLQIKKLLNSKSENALDEENEDQVSSIVKQLMGVIAAFVLGILLMIFLWGDINLFKTPPKFLEQKEFQPLKYCFCMAMGVQSVVGSLRTKFDIQKSSLESTLFLLEFMLLVSALVAILIDGSFVNS